MCELFKIDTTVLKKIDEKLDETYSTFNSQEKKYRNYNFLILKTTQWNKFQKEKFHKFQQEVSPKTADGKKNNKYYRGSFKHWCVIDSNSYNLVMSRLNYCAINSVSSELKMLKNNLDKIFLVMSLIIQNSTDKIKENRFNKDDEIALAKKFLEYFIQRESSDLIAYMIHAGFIDGDLDTFNAGPNYGKCRKYWLNHEESKEYVVYPITNLDMISKRFSEEKEMVFEEKRKKESFVRNIKRDAKGVIPVKELHEFFAENITFDTSKAYDLLFDNLDINPINFSHFVAKSSESLPYKFNKIGRDLFGNRLYHPFCNFPKSLRQFISINDVDTTDTIDICNSQPYFFVQLFNISFLNHIKNNTSILTDDEYTLIHSYAVNPENKELIKALGGIVSNGIYYDYISNEANISRGEAKLQNMYLFFSEGFNKISAKLKFEFKILIEVKEKISRFDKSRFAQILQQIESHIIIDKIFYPLKEMGINTVPIHDAFITKKEDVAAVETYIHNLAIQMNIQKIPYSKMNNKVSDKKRDKLIIQYHDRFKVYREAAERKEYDRYLMNTLVVEKMNYMVFLMGDKRSKFGKHRKGDKHFDLLKRVTSHRFTDDDELKLANFEKSLEFFKETAQSSYDFYLRDGDTFKNYSQYNGVRYVREEKITPLDFMNKTYGSEFKNRVNFNHYNYHKEVE